LSRAHISQPDGTFGMKVKRCFSFSDINSTVELVNEEGCPEPSIMSEFRSVSAKQLSYRCQLKSSDQRFSKRGYRPELLREGSESANMYRLSEPIIQFR
jgi:hypothetical protein